MKSISPKAHFRQRVIKYSAKNGVTAASIRYRVCRKAIYDWKKRYDGRCQSLIDLLTVRIAIQGNKQQKNMQ